MDNEASITIQQWLANDGITFQFLVPSSCHRFNITERALQLGKYHITAWICTTDEDKDFPIIGFDRLVPQADLICNMFRATTINLVILSRTTYMVSTNTRVCHLHRQHGN